MIASLCLNARVSIEETKEDTDPQSGFEGGQRAKGKKKGRLTYSLFETAESQ
jgi:hypothetical protein